MKYDLIVIGGGPAGMMAAGRAAELGGRVLLLEKNANLGIKLLITGKERCNLSNAISVRELVTNFGAAGKFLFSAFSRFDPEMTMDFFSERGVPLKIENNNRVFPVSNKSQDVLQALKKYLQEFSVEIITKAEVKNISQSGGQISGITLADGRKFSAQNYLIATGGLSYPGTGSSGDGYSWLKKLGHQLAPTYPALTPIICSDSVEELEGLSLSGAKFTCLKNNKTLNSRTGEAIFTAKGLSGPAIFAISAQAARALPGAILQIDLFPEKSEEKITAELKELFQKNNNRQVKNVLAGIIPERLAIFVLQKAEIELTKEINQITKTERLAVIKFLKNFSLEIKSVEGYQKAMLTAGGLDLKEVDPKTMRSKVIKNLLVAGEVLDLDGPTGGFNLQCCWSTGRLAGESAVASE